MDWRIKALVQKTLASLPGGRRAHYLLQRRLGAFRKFKIDTRVHSAARLLELLGEAGVHPAGKTMVEIGTGWAPVVPTYLHLCGAARCITYDLNRYLKEALFRQALEQFGDWIDEIAATRPSCEADVRRRWAELVAVERMEEVMRIMRLDYRAPADARQTGLGEGSVDVVFSNLVLEHVPPLVIEALFGEAHRVLNPQGGVMVHRVDPGDHFSSFDGTITRINFLRYSRRRWSFWGENGLHYQNRLRAPQYRRMAEQAGFSIIAEHNNVDPRSKEALHALKLDAEFTGFSTDELCTVSYDFVARPV
ncbi:MAG TPA: class I SAM-dependent methyltransferase [Phycisphaerae bacterium]|nr:class I SAM-dependent methyltransferase [Phycisphaerae bacterium]